MKIDNINMCVVINELERIMKYLKNGIIFLVLAFALEVPHISLRLLGVITIIQDRDWLANSIAILSIIGVVFYVTGIISLLRFVAWRRKRKTSNLQD
jgi:hypothetical protein